MFVDLKKNGCEALSGGIRPSVCGYWKMVPLLQILIKSIYFKVCTDVKLSFEITSNQSTDSFIINNLISLHYVAMPVSDEKLNVN